MSQEQAPATKTVHICIEGLIGVGKTTMLTLLANSLGEKIKSNTKVFAEPVDEWQDFGQNRVNLLKLMYDDPKQYSFQFQNVAFSTKCKQLAGQEGVKIVERSLLAQSKVFIPILLREGNITELESEILVSLIDIALEKTPGMSPDMILYLRTNPKIALQRIKNRGRPEESAIDLKYLHQLYAHYELWFKHEQKIPVIVVESLDLKEINISNIVNQIMALI
jgi:deoxyadenosine/deoxycytidine kinase